MYTCWDEEEGCSVSEEMKGEEAENRGRGGDVRAASLAIL